MIAFSSTTIDRVRALATEGAFQAEIAREVGLSRHGLARLCAEHDIALAPSAERLAAGRAKGLAAASLRPCVPVPAWVPKGLRADYRDFAAEFGEHEAARRVRRLKAEAEGRRA